MKRLLLSVLWIVSIFAVTVNACAEKYTFPDCPDVFWDDLIYMGEKIDISVPPPGREMLADTWDRENRDNHYRIWLSDNRDVCDMLTWRDITFRYSELPPFDYLDMCTDLQAWQRYFNELYYDAQRNILNEAGFSPFWEGMRFNGNSVDPFKEPPNYVQAYDQWSDERADIGYGVFWSHYFTKLQNEYSNPAQKAPRSKKAQEPVWTWYGAVFKPGSRPKVYEETNIETDPFHLNRLSRGYLECWEEYFNDLYEQNVYVPNRTVGEYYAWIKLKDKDSYLNVRKKASASSKSLAKLKHGQRIIVMGPADTDGWVKVIYDMDITAENREDGSIAVSADYRYGYIRENYLSK